MASSSLTADKQTQTNRQFNSRLQSVVKISKKENLVWDKRKRETESETERDIERNYHSTTFHSTNIVKQFQITTNGPLITLACQYKSIPSHFLHFNVSRLCNQRKFLSSQANLMRYFRV